MNLTPFDFNCMTLVEYILKLRGFNKARSREWEHTRAIAHIVESTKPGVRMKPPEEWMPLPTDRKKRIFLSEEEMIANWNLAAKRHG